MTTKDYQKIFHEIKNHITFINSSLQLVEKTHPEMKEISYWNDAMREVTSLKNMLIRLSSARLSDTLNVQRISLENFLPEFISSCKSIFDSEGFQYELEIESSLPEISIDPERFRRALMNLIKNSYEAMNGSGIVRFFVQSEASSIRLDITDFGGGIPAEISSKLFTPFETTKADGTGLGLLITKQIIESHDGRLTVDSRPGDGCTFSIYLPYAS